MMSFVYLTEESNKRPWRPQSAVVMHRSTWSLIETQRELMVM